MRLSFLDRTEEIARLERLFARSEGSLGVLYGRRRCGKSRLLRETLPPDRYVYYAGDDRDGTLQRSGLAREIGRFLPGFDQVEYRDWEALLSRWWLSAPPGSILALDEFPAMVTASPELPSLLQKFLDQQSEKQLHLLLTGSAQRMMQGLVLDRTAPLFGRAFEIMKIGPLPAGWIEEALSLDGAAEAVEAFAVWGGTPRYWELAVEHPHRPTALRELVLSPLGVLHEEPRRLLLDDLRDTTQSISILSLIGQGCHRLSEIAARLERPATALSRPLQRLTELGLAERQLPYGAAARGQKRSLYRISEPFLRFWFRFVEVHRSLLEIRRFESVERDIELRFSQHAAEVWEDLARQSVPFLDAFDHAWKTASRWWGPGSDRRPLEVDLVAESVDGTKLLIGEVKWTSQTDPERLLQQLAAKAERLPFLAGREVFLALWLRTPEAASTGKIFTPEQVLAVLR